MVQTRRRLPRHGHAADSFRRILPQILANEACATKDSNRWILFREVQNPARPRLPPPRTRRIEARDNYNAGHGSERFAPSRSQVTNGQLYWGRVEPRRKTRAANRLAHFPVGSVHPIDNDPRYINELEQVLVDKIVPFFQDLVSGPTCVLELK
jgi:hypothetical protein